MNCRHCNKLLKNTFIDLGYAPPSNAYLNENDLNRPEIYYPLKIKVCNKCWLVQTEDFADAEALFTSEYAYFSSTSITILLLFKLRSLIIFFAYSLACKSQLLEVLEK